MLLPKLTKTPAKSGNVPPWLELARADLGTKEIVGGKNNEKILAYYAACGHPDVDDEETPWCAAAMGAWLKSSGYPIPPKKINLTAGSYESYGTLLKEPKLGCIRVSYRGSRTSWERHVCIYLGPGETPGTDLVIGGNQKNSVSITEMSNKHLCCYRWPVAATIKDLKAAGSVDLAVTSVVKIGAKAGVAIAAVGEALNSEPNVAGVIERVPVPTSVPDISLEAIKEAAKTAAEQAGFWESTAKTLTGAAHGLGSTILANQFLLALVIVAGVAWVAAKKLEAHRVKRAAAGHPVSAQG